MHFPQFCFPASQPGAYVRTVFVHPARVDLAPQIATLKLSLAQYESAVDGHAPAKGISQVQLELELQVGFFFFFFFFFGTSPAPK